MPHFLQLPPEVHTHVSSFLDTRELLPFALVCRQARATVSKRLDESIALDGTHEAKAFIHRYRKHARSLFCAHGRPLNVTKRRKSSLAHAHHGIQGATSDDDGHSTETSSASSTSSSPPHGHLVHDSGRLAKRCRVERIRELTLYDVRPVYAVQDASSDDSADEHMRDDSQVSPPASPTSSFRSPSHHTPGASPVRAGLREGMPGNIIGVALSLLPNLETLVISQCPIPVNMAMAYAISVFTPRLRRLTLRSPHVDASALAMLVRNLAHLEELEVGSVKTCWCRGALGRQEGAKDLADALHRAASLKRIVFNSSAVTAVDGGLLFKLLAQTAQTYRCADSPIVAADHVWSANAAGGVSCSPDSARARRVAHNHGRGRPMGQTQRPDQEQAGGERSGVDAMSFSPRSLELRRSGLHGNALVTFLASPSAARLRRLFIGGCKSVRPIHLAKLMARRHGHSVTPFVLSREPLYLEIDGRLLTREVLLGLSHRIVYLRVFEPAPAHVSLIESCLADGALARCRHIVICPSQGETESTDARMQEGGDEDADEGPASSADDGDMFRQHRPRSWRDIQSRLQQTLASRKSSPGESHTDVSIGDTAWWKMNREREEMRRWARDAAIAAASAAAEASTAVGNDIPFSPSGSSQPTAFLKRARTGSLSDSLQL
ncbi:unnamed protein product [Parajaminaea phylloscopi]